jgi:TRAP-type C4-dicarboxylate transport system permease small subunit
MSDIPTPSPSPAPALERALSWLSALPVALIVTLTFADVLGRYLLSSPVRGSMEIIEFAMALVVFTALPLVTLQRGHVSVSLIDNLFTGKGRYIKRMLCDAVSALALGLLSWRLCLQSMDDLQTRAATVVLGLPNAALSLTLTFFAGLSTVVVLMHLFQTCRAFGSHE